MSKWIDEIFSAGQARKGNLVRRSLRSVSRHSSFDELMQAVLARGFHMAVIGDQCVILCNRHGTMNLVC